MFESETNPKNCTYPGAPNSPTSAKNCATSVAGLEHRSQIIHRLHQPPHHMEKTEARLEGLS